MQCIFTCDAIKTSYLHRVEFVLWCYSWSPLCDFEHVHVFFFYLSWYLKNNFHNLLGDFIPYLMLNRCIFHVFSMFHFHKDMQSFTNSKMPVLWWNNRVLNISPTGKQRHIHGDSIIGRKVTDAVICRITLWISFFTSASSFCLREELLTAQKSTTCRMFHIPHAMSIIEL